MNRQLVVVPQADDIGAYIGDLEDRLLWLDPDGDVDVEHVELALEAATAIGNLAMAVGHADRYPPPTQPVAPDGQMELAPLVFVSLDESDRGTIRRFAAAIADERVRAWLEADVAAGFLRVAAVVGLPADDEVARLRVALDRGPSSGPEQTTERVVLNRREADAYRFVIGRFVDAWSTSGIDTALQRFAHLGAL